MTRRSAPEGASPKSLGQGDGAGSNHTRRDPDSLGPVPNPHHERIRIRRGFRHPVVTMFVRGEAPDVPGAVHVEGRSVEWLIVEADRWA